jgi:hypothetical protein
LVPRCLLLVAQGFMSQPLGFQLSLMLRLASMEDFFLVGEIWGQ